MKMFASIRKLCMTALLAGALFAMPAIEASAAPNNPKLSDQQQRLERIRHLEAQKQQAENELRTIQRMPPSDNARRMRSKLIALTSLYTNQIAALKNSYR